MLHNRRTCPLFFALVGVVSTCQAQVMTQMVRDVHYNGVYGAGGDSHTPSGSLNATNFVNTDSQHLFYTGSTSGSLSGDPYTAGADCDLTNRFTVFGSLPGVFSGISASAVTTASTFATGPATSFMHCSNPGNRMEFDFTLSSTTAYAFSGFIDQGGVPGNVFELITLQRFNGFNWENIFFSPFDIVGGEGSFNTSGSLIASDYRIISSIDADPGPNEVKMSSYNYNFQMVPEPMTLLVLIPGLAILALRKRRS